ncbi:MAG: hypothetical protein Aurels2KO_12430 [Aureliella sp.]
MRRTLTRLLLLGLIATPISAQHAQEPGQTGEQPSAILDSPEVAELKRRERDERRKIATLSKNLGSEHPHVAKLQQQLEFTQKELIKLSPDQAVPRDDELVPSSFLGALQRAPSEQQIRNAFTVLSKTLRTSNDEGKREEARAKLGKLLKFQLNKDLLKRQSQLDAAEKKLAKLREQLESRKNNQAKVAEVLLLMIENPEAGVGIPRQWLQSIMPAPRPSPASLDPFAGPASDDPFGHPSPMSDPFGGSPTGSEDPFGTDPFGGPSNKPSSDPFGEPVPGGGDDPFGSASGNFKSDPFAGDPMDTAKSNPFSGPKPAYEVSLQGRDISVYETYDKGVPILTSEVLKIGLGEGESIAASGIGSIWMTKKGVVEVQPDLADKNKLVIVGLKKSKVQIALHPASAGMSQGIQRINVEVIAPDNPDTQPALPTSGTTAR